MKSSNKQFDDLIKQKLKTLHFEPNESAQHTFLRQLQQKKKKSAFKTWGKLSILILAISSLVLLQQNIQYRYKKQQFKAQTYFQEALQFTSNSLFTNASPTTEAPTKDFHLGLDEQLTAILQNDLGPSFTQVQEKQDEAWQKLTKGQLAQPHSLRFQTAKTAPAIADLFKYEGSALLEQKASAAATVICGQNREKTKIVIARSRIAHFQADSMAQDSSNGVCRPSGLDDDAVIQYNVFDKSSLFRRFQAENIHWGVVRTTKIGKPVKSKTETEGESEKKVDVKETNKKNTPKQAKPKQPRQTNETSYSPKPTCSSYHQHSVRQYLEPEYEAYNYFVKNDSLIFISEKVNYVVTMQPDGTILSKAQIEITEPYVYYLGEKRAFYDQGTGKIYLCIATLYHFNFYELEPANGKTTFLFHLDDVWPNPDFQINNGKLNYTYKNKNYSRPL